MKILVLNLGSTSFKFKLFDFKIGEQALASGGVESIGSENGGKYRIAIGEVKEEGICICPLHGDAMDLCIERLQNNGVISSIADVDAIGYKAVHGGKISGAQLIDDGLLEVMESFFSFVPAHNPVYVSTMRQIREKYPELRQVAYFETSFHQTMPDYRAAYAVPYEWQEKFGIRRYGFHGSSHSYIAQKMQQVEPKARKVISMHLGGSSSLCAIKDGKSIATSMGATTQSGIFHNNRVGDFDVFCIPELVKQYDGDLNMVMKQLSSNGGFLGLSGVSNDLREVVQAREEGNSRADLAVRSFVDGIVGYIGMYTAYLGGVDALVFTGGIGQHSDLIRSMVCEALEYLGVKLDKEKNSKTHADQKISMENSNVDVWVLETNEELMVARQTRNLLSN